MSAATPALRAAFVLVPWLLSALLVPRAVRAEDGAGAWLLYLEAGADAVEGAGFLLAEPGVEYRGTDLQFALGAPLRLAVVEADGATAGRLRPQDWDEPSDAGQVLRRLSFGREGEDLRLVAGSIPPATLGHGSIVAEHRPSVDLDHPRAGAQLRLGTGGVALDAVAGDVLAPRVFAGRLELPLGAFVGLGDRLVLGGTYAIDPVAQAGPTRAVDEAGRVTSETEPAQLAGVDLGLVLARAKWITVAPYVDGAALLGGGLGLHAGAAIDLRLGRGGETILGLRGEYRQLGAGYLPRYFDAFYEVERHAYPTVRGAPKRLAARASPAGAGLLAEARLGREGVYAAGVLVEGRGHGPIAAELFAELRALPGLSAAALLARRGALSPLDVLDLDGETWALAEVRGELTRHLYLFAVFARGYHLSPSLGRPDALLEVSAGAGGITDL